MVVTIVIQSADAFNFAPGKAFINGLKAVKGKLGGEVHYIHVGPMFLDCSWVTTRWHLLRVDIRLQARSSFRRTQVFISY